MCVFQILQQNLEISLCLSNRVFSVEDFEGEEKAKLLQNLNLASVICICYDFFFIY